MRDYKLETEKRVQFIKDTLKEAHANGIVFGNSGGKDSALVGILCKMACDNTVGIMMPCSKRNFNEDLEDGNEVAKKFNIKTEIVDIADIKALFDEKISKIATFNQLASANISPRVRMTTLYAYGACNNMLVAGTGNRTETFVGYFTKWGDGACDFNPISDLTVKEVYEFLTYLGCPDCIIKKAPSAALFDGQTDEKEMGMTYADLDSFITTGIAPDFVKEKATRMHERSEHKRKGVKHYNKIQ